MKRRMEIGNSAVVVVRNADGSGISADTGEGRARAIIGS
jgi:hypothetical protein